MENATNQPQSVQPAGKGRNNARLSFLVIFAVAVVILIGLFSITRHSSSSAKLAANNSGVAVVDVTSAGFVPATIMVKQGQTVDWLNQDSQPHQPITDPYPIDNGLPGFMAPSPLNTGDTYSFTFEHVGTFTYHDQLHPFNIKGTIMVN